MIKIENLSKTFRTTEVETIALKPRSTRKRVCCHYGTFGMRQIYLTEYPRTVG